MDRSLALRITSSFQQKPVDKVVAEIKEAMKYTDNPFFELADDNTFINKKWSKEFLRAIIPLNISWFTETDISIADDEEFLDLLAQSGCRQVLIGLESPEQEALEGMNRNKWKYKRFETYLESIDKIQSKGISINGCFIVGLDNNTKESFKRIRDFALESKLIEVQITVQNSLSWYTAL